MISPPRSALDEMLGRRIPIQLGGMTDPFSEAERTYKVTLNTLEVLNEFYYPTLISTKGLLCADLPYINLLKDGNYFIRISITGAPPRLLKKIEQGVATIRARLKAITKLSSKGLKVSVRLQPIIPGHENYTEKLIESISSAGAVHISAEYLKWPIEHKSHQSQVLDQVIKFNKERYLYAGAIRVGREYVLPPEFKLDRLNRMKDLAEQKGLLFGFADNEFLHFNNFKSCCNGADMFLHDANFFTANILTAVKVGVGDRIYFDKIMHEWRPAKRLGPYLNSRSRIKEKLPPGYEWIEILRRKWNSKGWRGGPESFFGVVATDDLDDQGNVVYRRLR